MVASIKAREIELKTLSEKLTAIDSWKWSAGMLASCGLRADETMEADDWSSLISGEWGYPIISDAGTQGCMLGLILELGGNIERLSILPMGSRMIIEWPNGIIAECSAKSYGEVLAQILMSEEYRI